MSTRTYTINLTLPADSAADAAESAHTEALAAELATIREQLANLKELFMSTITELLAKFTTANATMAAGVLTVQQLRQKLDAEMELRALAEQALATAQATPALPAGAVILTAEEQAALAAMNVSVADSAQALADAIEANALNQTQPPVAAP